MAQPNLQALSQHLIRAGQEVALIPNLPVFNLDQQLNAINLQLQNVGGQMGQIAANNAALNNQIAANNAALNNKIAANNTALNNQITLNHAALNVQITQLLATQDLLPMHLQNASASNHAHIWYPLGFVMVPQAPILKQDLLTLNVVACQVTALPGNPTMAQRRQQIIDHLGAGLNA